MSSSKPRPTMTMSRSSAVPRRSFGQPLARVIRSSIERQSLRRSARSTSRLDSSTRHRSLPAVVGKQCRFRRRQPKSLQVFSRSRQLVDHHLEAHQRAHAREQGDVVDRLGQEVVGARLQPAHPVGAGRERRDHDHRDMGWCRGLALSRRQTSKPSIPGIMTSSRTMSGMSAGAPQPALEAVAGDEDLEIFRRQLGFEQLDIGVQCRRRRGCGRSCAPMQRIVRWFRGSC